MDEANAIGTTYLRADVLPPELRVQSQALLREYINTRVNEMIDSNAKRGAA